ncbi:OLC1v1025878C1 [Oldenlandia corymbosa var. corymbosa]|uniref:OLC1v1025878C1 n=1 Tax=Oldenlandia corymbosa var. corymbosa TaxID=529605 RepID=A0AAV1C845_OLDCO|nr:OLC1v1025878C1 [Oldenlandia corymbosa var. corymbosa]
MLGLGCCCFDDEYEQLFSAEPKQYSLPAPLPQWPQGQGFATGSICLGEIEVVQITKFERVWGCKSSWKKTKGVSFYRPVDVPKGFFCLGHYCQPDDQYLQGHVFVAREVADSPDDRQTSNLVLDSPALAKPLSYTLVWGLGSNKNGHGGFIWLPNAPEGYKSMGFLVTNEEHEPELDEVRCVRADLTEACETDESLFSADKLNIWNTRPCERGMCCTGVSVGTFFCSTFSWSLFPVPFSGSVDDSNIACLKNLDTNLKAMPNLDQIHALIKHYGPTVYFHPDEEYLPSSVSWFFDNGALLYEDGKDEGVAIKSNGSNLPSGGDNDGRFWLDLALKDEARDALMRGNIETAELYVHVKPALGGSFTDIAMWIFCPFNGPATIKAGVVNMTMNRVGEHVGDWEHYTLRISNFTGELWNVYFSEHSGGEWLHASELEFIKDNKPVVYSSRNGHASFPHAGCYIQGSSKLGLGVRNDCDQSKYFLDSSTKYQIVAAEYLGDGVITEPDWLQYMREWGPTIEYDSRSEVDKIIKHLPFFVRFTVESLFELFPTELYGEEGPTGPKEKDNWIGDERC